MSVATADHVKELPQHIQRDMKLSRAAASEKRRYREAGADSGEIVVGVHCTAIGEVRALIQREEQIMSHKICILFMVKVPKLVNK